MSLFREFPCEGFQLRNVDLKDQEAFYAIKINEEVQKYLGGVSKDITETVVQNKILKLKDDNENDINYFWVIEKNGQMAGSICVWGFNRDRTEAELGYELLPAAQGRGIMTKAVKEIITFSFQVLHLHQLYAYTHKENDSSLRLLKRCGFHYLLDAADDNVVYVIKNPIDKI